MNRKQLHANFYHNVQFLLVDLTQKEIAKKLRIGTATVSRFNKWIPSIEVLIKISNYTGVSLDKLLKEKIS